MGVDMRLNKFGTTSRVLRMELDVSLKEQADAMQISSAHLSALEYGDKKLNEKHISSAIDFFKKKNVAQKTLENLQTAGIQSMNSISTEKIPTDAKAMVYAFARKLQEANNEIPSEILDWLNNK
jgi:hypothetical protein